MVSISRELSGWAPTQAEAEVYEEWVLYRKYPYHGGMLDQPQWFFDLRHKMSLLDEWHRLNEGLREAKHE